MRCWRYSWPRRWRWRWAGRRCSRGVPRRLGRRTFGRLRRWAARRMRRWLSRRNGRWKFRRRARAKRRRKWCRGRGLRRGGRGWRRCPSQSRHRRRCCRGRDVALPEKHALDFLAAGMDLTAASTEFAAFLVLLRRQRAPRRLGLRVLGKLLVLLAGLAHTEAYDHSPQSAGRASATWPLPKPRFTWAGILMIGAVFVAANPRQRARRVMCGASHAKESEAPDGCT